ncbi:MAG: iron-sulfur cluster assembly scaffold protein [Patescibacteria group bacterium]
MYTKKVLKHFQNPHNYGRMKDPDGVGKVGNLVCGDVMWLYIRVGKNIKKQEIIKDIKFETFGCVAAIATSSAITDLAKGKTVAEALEITKEKIVNNLGGLPPIKIHCSVLAADALAEALYDYLKKNKREISLDMEKKHQILQKEKETLVGRHKEWVETEEKMHGHE